MAFENEHLTRQLDLIPLAVLQEKITIIGAGAIGSFTALALAKMGFTDITVYDFDKIEVENMNCQFYRFGDIGSPKVEALQGLVENFTGVKIDAKNKPYKKGMFQGIVISAVDSMEVRRLIWENHKATAIATRMIVDPRMGAEFATVYAMNPMSPEDIESYEKTLHTDADGVQERCTAKSTIYTALLLSGYVAKVVKDILCADKYSRVTNWNIASAGIMNPVKDAAPFQAWTAENKQKVL